MTAFNVSKTEVTGLILAGGQGRRVGGQDKGLLVYQNKPLVAHQIDWLKSQLSQIIISANRNLPVYQSYGFQTLHDQDSHYRGPLQGILQGLRQCQTEWLFVLPVDVPHLPTNLIEMLLARIKKRQLAYYLKTDIRAHYLSMLVNRSALTQLEQRLNNNQNRVRDFLTALNAEAINLDIAEDCFANLNTSEDY